MDVLDTTEGRQAVVGGNLEQFGTITRPEGRKIVFYVNADARALGLRRNRVIKKVRVVGPVLVVALEDSRQMDMTDAEVELAIDALNAEKTKRIAQASLTVVGVIFAVILWSGIYSFIHDALYPPPPPPPPNPAEVAERQRQLQESQRAIQELELLRKEQEIEKKHREWEQGCADQGLHFVGTIDGKVECRK